MPPISALIKPASGNCNMHCDYCFYSDEQSKREIANHGIMSEKTLNNIMRKVLFHSKGYCTIAFQGGEPTLAGLDFFKKVVELGEKYNKNGLRINYALQTNGYHLDENWCRFFKDNGFLIGLSVDGTKEIHDKYRHSKELKPTYEKVRSAAKLMDLIGVDYNILTVVHKDVAMNIEKIYQDYKKNGWRYQQYIACLDPLYEAPGQHEYSLLPHEYGRFLIRLFQLWHEDFNQNRQPYIRQFENYIAMLLGQPPESCDQRGTCGLQYVFESDGSAYPCDFYMLDDYCLGNINDTIIDKIDEQRKKSRFIEKSIMLSTMCRDCEFFGLCKGGCMRCRQSLDGSNYINYFCEGYKEFFKECLPELREIANTVKKRIQKT